MKGKLLVGRAELCMVIGALSRDGETKPVRNEMLEMLEKSIVHPEDATSASEDLMLIEECQGVDIGQKVIALRRITIETETGNTVILHQDFKGEVLQCTYRTTGHAISLIAGQFTRDIYSEAFDRSYRRE